MMPDKVSYYRLTGGQNREITEFVANPPHGAPSGAWYAVLPQQQIPSVFAESLRRKCDHAIIMVSDVAAAPDAVGEPVPSTLVVCNAQRIDEKAASIDQEPDRRTKRDFAERLWELADVHYPEAERIVLVMDNLNTHTPGSLYERFEPEEARRLAEKFEMHYTPKHGSWLNMAEIELGVFSRQCLKEHMESRQDLASAADGWEQQRNAHAFTVDWQFRTDDVRIKMKSLYPSIE